MFLLSANGLRSIPDERVIYLTREWAPGRYQPCTVVLDDGREVSGLGLKEALDKLEAALAAVA